MMTDEELATLGGARVDRRLVLARQCMDQLVALVRAPDCPSVADALAGHMQGALMEHLRHLRKVDPGAWHAGLTQIRSVRGTSDAVRRLVALAGVEVLTAQPDDVWLPDGLPAMWKPPERYAISRSGVWWQENEESHVRITTRALWVVGYLVDVDGRGHHLRLMWQQVDGSCHVEAVPLGSAMDSRGILALATRGCPVTSSNARSITGYLDAGVATLQGRIPVAHCAGRLGWIPAAAGGGFMWGSHHRQLQADDVGHLELMADPAVQQVAAAYGKQGTWSGWLAEVLEPAQGSAAIYLALYASVASVLLHPLQVSANYALDFSGETSTGKTTAQKAAASVWGDPRGLVRSWAVSAAGLEAYAAMLQHLPIILDDSKKARRPDDVAGLVYLHSGGTGAVRGKPGSAGQSVGLRRVESWRSWLISSGEQRLTDFSRDAGTRARVLAWVGSPLDSADAAQSISLGAESHYGHLGCKVLTEAMAVGADELQLWLADAREVWRTTMVERDAPAVARRLADAIAVLDVARRLCQNAGLPDCRVDVMAAACSMAMAAATQSDQPAAALRLVYEWCTQRQAQFCGRNPDRIPSGGFLGRWEEGRWDVLMVLPRVVDEVLAAHGFDAGVRQRWLERGWVDLDRNGCPTRRAMVGGARCRVLCLKRAALIEVGSV